MNHQHPTESLSDPSKKIDVQAQLKAAFEENKRKREEYKAKLYQKSPTLQSAYKALAESGAKVPEYVSASKQPDQLEANNQNASAIPNTDHEPLFLPESPPSSLELTPISEQLTETLDESTKPQAIETSTGTATPTVKPLEQDLLPQEKTAARATKILLRIGPSDHQLAEKLNRIRNKANQIALNVKDLTKKKIEKVGK